VNPDDIVAVPLCGSDEAQRAALSFGVAQGVPDAILRDNYSESWINVMIFAFCYFSY
jgi:hypothetical protein